MSTSCSGNLKTETLLSPSTGRDPRSQSHVSKRRRIVAWAFECDWCLLPSWCQTVDPAHLKLFQFRQRCCSVERLSPASLVINKQLWNHWISNKHSLRQFLEALPGVTELDLTGNDEYNFKLIAECRWLRKLSVCHLDGCNVRPLAQLDQLTSLKLSPGYVNQSPPTIELLMTSNRNQPKSSSYLVGQWCATPVGAGALHQFETTFGELLWRHQLWNSGWT